MCTKLIRNWSGVLRNGATALDQCHLHRTHRRHFILPPRSDASHVKVVNNELVPQLIYKYNVLKYYMSKLRLWKLRWTWDRSFKERDFVEESKQVAVNLTDILRLRDMSKIANFSTSNLHYQMASESLHFPHESFGELLRFRKQDIRQAVPINVQLHNILGLKYAVIDVVMVGLRHVADCETSADLEKMKSALIDVEPELKPQLEDPSSQMPYVFIELFMRFRRNYSSAKQITGVELENHTNRWLVSVYKICRFNIFTVPPVL